MAIDLVRISESNRFEQHPRYLIKIGDVSIYFHDKDTVIPDSQSI